MIEVQSSIKRVELAKVGVFGSNQTQVTEQDLQQIEENFEGDAPIVLGHAMARQDSYPRFGRVLSVSYDPNTQILTGDIELNELLTDAWNKKFYTKWSIGARTNANGKRYLHHLALLGATPPGIKDLKVIQELEDIALSDVSKCENWEYSDSELHTQEDNGKKPETQPADNNTAEGAHSDTDTSESRPPQTATQPAAKNQAHKEDSMPEPQNKERWTGMQLPRNDADNQSQELSDAQARAEHAEAKLREVEKEKLLQVIKGKVPKNTIPAVLALADAIPTDTTIELSDENGDKYKKTGYQLIADIFAAIQAPVQEGPMNLGDDTEEAPAQVSFKNI